MKLIRLVVSIVVILVLQRPSAAGDKIVLESYTGGKLDQGGRLMSPLLDELARRGFLAGYDVVGRKFESRVSRPALVGRGLPADFVAQVDAGHKAWIAGKFDEAVKILGPLVDTAHANTGAFAQSQALRDGMLKALIALALSQQRMGDPSATRQTFGEILRSFPGTVLSRATYGPDAVGSLEQARKELGASGRGKLVVRASTDSAVIYINEHIEAAGSSTKDDLVPGEYRVFAQLGKQLSRCHHVVVKANETTVVTIDAGFDLAVQTSATWTGLSYTNASDRERTEATHAAAFGNALDAGAVAVIGIDHVRGKPAIVGVLVNLNGGEIRRASVMLDPDPSVDRMRGLAEFLAGENLTPEGVDVLVANEHPKLPAVGEGPVGVREGPEPRRTGMWPGWKFVTGGAALVTLGVGGGLLAWNGKCRDQPPAGMPCGDVYNTSGPGWATVGAGAALTAVTVYLFLRKGSSPSRSAYVVPATGGAMAGFAGRF